MDFDGLNGWLYFEVGDKMIQNRPHDKLSFIQYVVGIPDMKTCIVTADVQL